MPTWLLVDTPYLCWRSFYTTGGMIHDGIATGVSFGVLRDLESVTHLFGCDRMILAFDSKNSKRKLIYPNYKSSHSEQNNDIDFMEKKIACYEEINRLKETILPACGYKNVVCEDGYEADDVIAQIADTLPSNVEAVIVSADEDLWQCVKERVICYNPAQKKSTSARSFREKWEIQPYEWASVKALAGCNSDDIEGIPGVGNVTAAKWVAGKLKPESKAYKKINQNLEVYNKNIGLVKLPFPGLVLPELVDEEVTEQKVSAVKSNLGIQQRPKVKEPIGFEL